MSKVILSIETSSNICSSAIIQDDSVLSCVEELCPREHNEKLPQFIKKSLRDANKKVEELDALAVSIGPGSFTGLRIGLGFSKGLAFSHGLPLIPVPTILSLAFSLRDFMPSYGVVYSHAEKVFYQEFYWEKMFPKIKYKAIVKEVNQKFFKENKIDFHSNCEKFFKENYSIKKASHSAKHIGLLASHNYDTWQIKKPYDTVPEYIVPFMVNKRG